MAGSGEAYVWAQVAPMFCAVLSNLCAAIVLDGELRRALHV